MLFHEGKWDLTIDIDVPYAVKPRTMIAKIAWTARAGSTQGTCLQAIAMAVIKLQGRPAIKI